MLGGWSIWVNGYQSSSFSRTPSAWQANAQNPSYNDIYEVPFACWSSVRREEMRILCDTINLDVGILKLTTRY